jgi:hypothetical protein
MPAISATVFVNPAGSDDEVIVFGKGADLQRADSNGGISRIGGDWRQPSYQKAYLRAARVLLREATEANDLDQLGLPIFYLLRHSTELLIKDLLGMLYEIADMQSRERPDTKASHAVPSKAARDRLRKSHVLASLAQDLQHAVITLGFGEYFPALLPALINDISKYESSPTWSRYAMPSTVGANPHLKDEVAIPVVELHQTLELLVGCVNADPSQEAATLGGEIYFRWANLMQADSGD